MPLPSRCEAIQQVDTMRCERCNLTWDCSDTEPPPCNDAERDLKDWTPVAAGLPGSGQRVMVAYSSLNGTLRQDPGWCEFIGPKLWYRSIDGKRINAKYWRELPELPEE